MREEKVEDGIGSGHRTFGHRDHPRASTIPDTCLQPERPLSVRWTQSLFYYGVISDFSPCSFHSPVLPCTYSSVTSWSRSDRPEVPPRYRVLRVLEVQNGLVYTQPTPLPVFRVTYPRIYPSPYPPLDGPADSLSACLPLT